MKNNKETRLAEVRFEENEGKMILEGYAIVFEQETLIGDEERGFKEDPFYDCIYATPKADKLLILARKEDGEKMIKLLLNVKKK